MKSLESNAKLKKREISEVGGEVLSLIEDPRKRSYTPSADGEWLLGICIFFWSYVGV
ncbi:MAG: hypothetical protein ACREXR_13090 [Gammaproteobacteria bacterium]